MAGTDIKGEKAEYDATLQRWRDKRAKFEEGIEAEGAHTLGSFRRTAALSRGGPYRQNGYFYILGKSDRRDVYDKSLPELGENLKQAGKGAQGGVTPGSTQHAALYIYDLSRTFAFGKLFNFHAAFLPYRNEAHHLIPVEAISGEFNAEQLELLGKIPFNINHGENIIFLPKKNKDTLIHKLPQHSGSHPKYNDLVKGDLSKMKSQLTAKEQEDCKPEDPPPIGVLDDLIKLESKFWKFLIKQGPMNVNRRAAAEAESGV